MNWTEKKLQQLQQSGNIRGYSSYKKNKSFSADRKQFVPREKPKGLIWLEWNLTYWANERSLSHAREYKFCNDRKWSFDFAFPSIKIAVEYEGIYNQGMNGHTSQKHFNKDIEKYTRAQTMGWQVIRVTAKNYTTTLKTLNQLITNP